MKIGVARRNYVLEFGHGEAMMRAVRTDVGLAFLFKSSIVEELENRAEIGGAALDHAPGVNPVHRFVG